MAIITLNNNSLVNADVGKVLQVVTSTLTSEESTTSTSYVATSLDAVITPSSTSSKILVIVTGANYQNTSGSYSATIYRGATNLGSNMLRDYDAGSAHGSNSAIHIVDEPNTTSATTYTYYYKVNTGTGFISVNNFKSVMTLMEIAG
jgi:hypothetical protein